MGNYIDLTREQLWSDQSPAATVFRWYRSPTTNAGPSCSFEQHGDVGPILRSIEVLLFGNELGTTEVVRVDRPKLGVDPRAPRVGKAPG